GGRGGFPLERSIFSDEAVIAVNIAARFDVDASMTTRRALEGRGVTSRIGDIIVVGPRALGVYDGRHGGFEVRLRQGLVDHAQVGDPRPRVDGSNVGGADTDARG